MFALAQRPAPGSTPAGEWASVRHPTQPCVPLHTADPTHRASSMAAFSACSVACHRASTSATVRATLTRPSASCGAGANERGGSAQGHGGLTASAGVPYARVVGLVGPPCLTSRAAGSEAKQGARTLAWTWAGSDTSPCAPHWLSTTLITPPLPRPSALVRSTTLTTQAASPCPACALEQRSVPRARNARAFSSVAAIAR